MAEELVGAELVGAEFVDEEVMGVIVARIRLVLAGLEKRAG
ncbi:MAG: hypothetical protein AAGG55_14185 [Pseudomonadota bacterium]